MDACHHHHHRQLRPERGNEFRPRHDDDNDGTMRSKFLLPNVDMDKHRDDERKRTDGVGGGLRYIRQWPSGSKVFFVLTLLKLTCVPFVAPMVLITGLWSRSLLPTLHPAVIM